MQAGSDTHYEVGTAVERGKMTNPSVPEDIAGLDAQALREGFLAGSLSPVSALAASLTRIERLDSTLNVFVA